MFEPHSKLYTAKEGADFVLALQPLTSTETEGAQRTIQEATVCDHLGVDGTPVNCFIANGDVLLSHRLTSV